MHSVPAIGEERVLIVEEQEKDATVLKDICRTIGFEPGRIDWKESLGEVRFRDDRACPDVVLLDLAMRAPADPQEGMDELARWRSMGSSSWKRVPVVIVTQYPGSVTAKTREKCYWVIGKVEDTAKDGNRFSELVELAVRSAIALSRRSRGWGGRVVDRVLRPKHPWEIVVPVAGGLQLKKRIPEFLAWLILLCAIIIAVFASAPGAESELAMVIRPNGCRPISVESPGPPAE